MLNQVAQQQQKMLLVLQVESFIDMVGGPAALYGYRTQTLYSLMLLVMSQKSETEPYEELFSEDERFFFHVELLKALNTCGINVVQVS